MYVVTKNLNKLDVPIPAGARSRHRPPASRVRDLDDESDALGPARLAIVQGRPAEESPTDHSPAPGKLTSRPALSRSCTRPRHPRLRENAATKEAGDEISRPPDHLRGPHRTAGRSGRRPRAGPGRRTGEPHPRRVPRMGRYQEIPPRLEAVRRVRNALGSRGLGTPPPRSPPNRTGEHLNPR